MEVVRIGSIWKERDTRFDRYVKVLGLPAPGFEHVRIQSVDPKTGEALGPKTRAMLSAFGKRYKEYSGCRIEEPK